MRVVALYRVSTEKQEAEGASLDSQQRAYKAHAARNGWATVAEFRGCESATQAATERRVLQQVLACIRDNAVDAVYVHEQSRLTRGDELEVALLMRELKERGVKIIVNGVVRDLSSIDERFMIGIQSLVDRAESERIKERMGRGKREKAKQGRKNSGPAPFGYINPPPGAPNRGRLQVVAEEAVVVRRLFALAAGGKGDHAVAEELNRLGLRAPRGGRWGKSSVRRALDNPAYIGTAASGVWRSKPGERSFRLDLKGDRAIVVPNAHEAIIDQETWDTVHNRPRLPRTAKPRMLGGMVWVNGLPYHGDSNRHASFYRAARGTRGNPWLLAGEADEAVWAAFASLATGPEFVQRIIDEARNPREQLVISQEIEYLDDTIAKREKRLNHLLDMRADGEITKDEYLQKSGEARAEVERMSHERSALQSKVVSLDGTVATRVARAVQVLLAGAKRLTVDQKRAILRSIVQRVDIVAEPTGVVQTRAECGLLAGSGGPRWAIRSVGFQLNVPAEVPGTANAEPSGADRDGQLVTTY